MAKAKKKRNGRHAAKPALIFQFLVVLSGTDPLVWRRIQVPASYTFWDLHVAIQDSMGWMDCHLHEFIVADHRRNSITRIGLPGEDMDEEADGLVGWSVGIAEHMGPGVGPFRYNYDFGDNWNHVVEFEDFGMDDGAAYPRCLDGAGACPPEDVGGLPGYAEFRQAIADRRHPEHEAMLEWVGGPFDPGDFDPEAVVFSDPKLRWEIAFGDEDLDS